MDINCTHNCKHQVDGKCALGQLPELTQVDDSAWDMDCIYYEEPRY